MMHRIIDYLQLPPRHRRLLSVIPHRCFKIKPAMDKIVKSNIDGRYRLVGRYNSNRFNIHFQSSWTSIRDLLSSQRER